MKARSTTIHRRRMGLPILGIALAIAAIGLFTAYGKSGPAYADTHGITTTPAVTQHSTPTVKTTDGTTMGTTPTGIAEHAAKTGDNTALAEVGRHIDAAAPTTGQTGTIHRDDDGMHGTHGG